MFQNLRVAAAFLSLTLLAVTGAAQIRSGTITGSAQDASGAVITDADVTVTNTAQGTVFKTVTNSDGEYSAPALQAGIYNLQITAPGFKTFQANGIATIVSLPPDCLQTETRASSGRLHLSCAPKTKTAMAFKRKFSTAYSAPVSG